jgi:uncharacterized protein (TIGR00251 family)
MRGNDPARAVRISVRAKPRAKVSRILGASGTSVDVAIAAPPVDGAANEELIAVLADALGVAKRLLRIVAGGGSKRKLVEVDGLTDTEVATRLAAAAERPLGARR